MPLTNILQALEAEAGRQVTEIEQETQAKIARIRSQTQAESDVVRNRQLASIEAPLRAEQARILNRAKLKALQIVQGTRENLITAAFEAATGRLDELTSTTAYAQVLRQLTREAFDVLRVSGQVSLYVRSDDVDLIEGIAQEMGLSAAVKGGLEDDDTMESSGGGLVAITSDGRISLINTQMERLRRVARQYRSQIADLLFNARSED